MHFRRRVHQFYENKVHVNGSLCYTGLYKAPAFDVHSQPVYRPFQYICSKDTCCKMETFIENYIVELILCGGILCTAPLARYIMGFTSKASIPQTTRDYHFIRWCFAMMFGGLLIFSLLLF